MRGILSLAGASMAILGTSASHIIMDDLHDVEFQPARRPGSQRMVPSHGYAFGSIADRPHRHRREIARRMTRPGTPERRAAMAAAK